MRALIASLLLLAACPTPTETPALARLGTVEATLRLPAGVGGDAWGFLYQPGEGPPGAPAVPAYVTAASAARLTGDPRLVFAQVAPNPWRFVALLDVNRNFDPRIDVLAQAGAGDRLSRGVALEAQPGRGAALEADVDVLVPHEPPAFRLEGVGDDLPLEPSLDAQTPLTLVADPLGRLDPKRTAFSFGLVDADGDGRPDDVDGDGTPDLSLQLFLRWLPLPGQAERGALVVVPLVFDPSPFLRTLEGRLGVTVSAQRVQGLIVPQALLLTEEGPRPFGAPPRGDYELVALTAGGQYWKIPNQLSGLAPGQGVRLHVDRASR